VSRSDSDIGTELWEITRHGITTKFVTSPGLSVPDGWRNGDALNSQLVLSDAQVPLTVDAMIVLPHEACMTIWEGDSLAAKELLKDAMGEIAHMVAHYVNGLPRHLHPPNH